MQPDDRVTAIAKAYLAGAAAKLIDAGLDTGEAAQAILARKTHDLAAIRDLVLADAGRRIQ